ncbi:MAG TPA: hypothetical protein VF165_18710 [Nocardioidaceae bacterium]
MASFSARPCRGPRPLLADLRIGAAATVARFAVVGVPVTAVASLSGGTAT